MELLKKVNKDIIKFTKDKDKISATTLKNLKTELINATVAGKTKKELTAGEEINVLNKVIASIKKSIVSYQDAILKIVDNDKLKNENLNKISELETEIKLLEVYQPKQLTEAEIETIISDVIKDYKSDSNLTMKDMGPIINIVKEKVAGQADGALISKLVKSVINK